MKTKAFFLLLTPIALLSFISPNSSNTYTPPGTVEIDAHIFMDETEITNISWQEYMYWTERIHGKTSEKYIATIPDSNVWNNAYKSHYLNHPAYRYYPVVGISWQQAKNFCKWRSDRVMEQVLLHKAQKPNKTYPTKITYRLPSPKEWEQIAKASYSEKTQKRITKKHKNHALANFKSENDSTKIHFTSPVYEYWPNKYGIYNMLGNVAEMTTVKGVAKGGSWSQCKNEVTVEQDFPYQSTQNWVGFRCICEVTF